MQVARFNHAKNRGRTNNERGTLRRVGISRSALPKLKYYKTKRQLLKPYRDTSVKMRFRARAFNCDEIYVDQIVDANNGENLLSR